MTDFMLALQPQPRNYVLLKSAFRNGKPLQYDCGVELTPATIARALWSAASHGEWVQVKQDGVSGYVRRDRLEALQMPPPERAIMALEDLADAVRNSAPRAELRELTAVLQRGMSEVAGSIESNAFSTLAVSWAIRDSG